MNTCHDIIVNEAVCGVNGGMVCTGQRSVVRLSLLDARVIPLLLSSCLSLERTKFCSRLDFWRRIKCVAGEKLVDRSQMNAKDV